jgi:hypothetical protein
MKDHLEIAVAVVVAVEVAVVVVVVVAGRRSDSSYGCPCGFF